jgi:hypothetical protein
MTDAAPVLRLFRFRPLEPAFDAVLRDTMLPDLAQRPGIRAIHLGRQGPGEDGERLVATVWESHAAMATTVGETFERPVFHPEYMDATGEKRLTIVPLAFVVEPRTPARGHVLRLVVGRTRSDAIDTYVREARSGTEADVAAGRGPSALYLGRTGDDEFVTLSAWDEWSTLAAATGGSVLSPAATRHDELLLEWTVTHYEAVPLADEVAIPTSGVSAADGPVRATDDAPADVRMDHAALPLQTEPEPA